MSKSPNVKSNDDGDEENDDDDDDADDDVECWWWCWMLMMTRHCEGAAAWRGSPGIWRKFPLRGGGRGGGSLSPGRWGIRGPARPFVSQSKTQGSPLGGYLSWSHVVKFTLKFLVWGLGRGSEITFVTGRPALWSVRWRSWFGLGQGSIVTILIHGFRLWKFWFGFGWGSVLTFLIAHLASWGLRWDLGLGRGSVVPFLKGRRTPWSVYTLLIGRLESTSWMLRWKPLLGLGCVLLLTVLIRCLTSWTLRWTFSLGLDGDPYHRCWRNVPRCGV